MGTNYYAVRNRPTTEEPIHIGKSSFGWKFNFQTQIDEYDEIISFDDFVTLVEEKQSEKNPDDFEQSVKEAVNVILDTAKRTDGDLISRQAAIDALDRIGSLDTEADKKYARSVFEALPSVQPERTCVNCGRTANNGGWYADGGTRCPIEEHYALPKDGYCHLWEKRNVTDDDYPERREE